MVSGIDEPAVVVRGGSAASPVAAAVEAAGGVVARTVAADAPADADSDRVDAVFAVGEAAFLAAATPSASVPVLPVDAGYGRHSLPGSAVGRAVEAIRIGEARVVEHPTLAVRVDGDAVGEAVADATLMTSEAARISEYAVVDGSGRVDSFRADGVVAATPLGSAGYARAAGGPVVARGAGVAVVPVSPYATETDVWVLRPPVALSVRRDDADVSLALDGVVKRRIEPRVRVEIARGEAVSLLRVPGVDDRTRA
jgi:NAD+ kinase